MTAVYIRNLFYRQRTGKTAFDMFTGHKANLSNMHTFGTVCYAYI